MTLVNHRDKDTVGVHHDALAMMLLSDDPAVDLQF
jgi:hypothetical protein